LHDDTTIIRDLAARYAEAAALDVQHERLQRYRDSNGLRRPRPIVLIDELPWGEMGPAEELALSCAEPRAREVEQWLRRWLYRWNRVQGDLVLVPNYPVHKQITSTGIGLSVRERTILADTGSDIRSHEYEDQLADEQDVEKLHLQELGYDREGTERRAAAVQDLLGASLPVRITGHAWHTAPWDEIAQYRGVGPLLYDLADRPAHMHRIMERLTTAHCHALGQMEALGLLEPGPVYLHCTPAATDELPAAGHVPGRARLRDAWGRHAAQIFSAVSPAMHDAFDVSYALRMTAGFGLLYYGCCEPLDGKIEILRKLENLRKISITPWADVDRAADAIGSDYVLSFKPNPASVAVDVFDPAPVRAEISRALAACRRNRTTVEIILKDISTVHNRPENLFAWEKTVMEVVAEEA
jgi:hypothetical protein